MKQFLAILLSLGAIFIPLTVCSQTDGNGKKHKKVSVVTDTKTTQKSNPKPSPKPDYSTMTADELWQKASDLMGVGEQRKAFDYLLPAAEKGNVNARYWVAKYYYHDFPGAKLDYTKAEEWARKAADAGHADAQFLMGDLYYYGNGVTKDLEAARRWYEKAASQGNKTARWTLDNCF